MIRTDPNDFWARVIPEPMSGCWIWLGTTSDKSGYGLVYVDGSGRRTTAHRVAWELTNGPIPPSAKVLHRCDFRICVWPGHLFLGTHADNMRDMVNKGRSCFGERNAFTHLTTADVESIRRSYTEGTTQTELAARFGVGQSTISRICRRQVWSRVEEAIA